MIVIIVEECKDHSVSPDQHLRNSKDPESRVSVKILKECEYQLE